VQRVQWKEFAESLGSVTGDGQTTINTAATIGLTHADSMFMVFPKDQNSHTCFLNPFINYAINLDGKFYPRENYNSWNDHKHLNMLYDALNINNSLLTSVSEDIRTSQQPFRTIQTYNASGSDKSVLTKSREWVGKDNSNFFIGIPFADNEDFMGGITTTGCVQIQLVGDRSPAEKELKALSFGRPIGIFFEDWLLKIGAIKTSRAQIEYTNRTIAEIMNGKAL